MNDAVHNHGPEDGPGLACRERLMGDCMRGEHVVDLLRRLVAVVDAGSILWTAPVPADSIAALHDSKEFLAADHPTRSPDSPTLIDVIEDHTFDGSKGGRCSCQKWPASGERYHTEHLAAMIEAVPPRSSDSVRTPDLDGERLYRTYWRTQWANPGVGGYKPARQWEQLQPDEQRIWHDTAAALHPASPPQEGQE